MLLPLLSFCSSHLTAFPSLLPSLFLRDLRAVSSKSSKFPPDCPLQSFHLPSRNPHPSIDASKSKLCPSLSLSPAAIATDMPPIVAPLGHPMGGSSRSLASPILPLLPIPAGSSPSVEDAKIMFLTIPTPPPAVRLL